MGRSVPRRERAPRVLMRSGRAGGTDVGCFDVRPPYHGWRPDGSERHLLFWTLAGRGRLGHEAGDVLVEAGQAALIRAEVPHDYGTERTMRRWRFHWVWFDPPPAWRIWLDWPEAAPGILRLTVEHPSTVRAISAALAEALERTVDPRPEGVALVENALERAILLLHRSVRPAAGDPRLAAILDRIHRDYARPLCLPGLARAAGMSVSALTAGFRRQFGISVRGAVERVRIEAAERLLAHGGLPVATVAEQVGFTDPFYFSRRFRRTTGRPPNAVRRGADSAS